MAERPSWRGRFRHPKGTASSTENRQVPDVSASADSERGITVYRQRWFQSDHWTTIGGTSESSPLCGLAILAEIAAVGPDRRIVRRSRDECRWHGTWICSPNSSTESASSTFATSPFHPITVGNNDAFQGLGMG